MAQNLSTLTALAARIAKSAEAIESFLKENQLPEPSFEADGPKNFPVTDKNPEILAARDELIDCTQELRDLVVGPTDTIKWRTMVVRVYLACCSFSCVLTQLARTILSRQASKLSTVSRSPRPSRWKATSVSQTYPRPLDSPRSMSLASCAAPPCTTYSRRRRSGSSRTRPRRPCSRKTRGCRRCWAT